MSYCKRCGKVFYLNQPMCPECTNRHNEVYNRSNLIDVKRTNKNVTTYNYEIRPIILTISFLFAILFFLYIFLSFFMSFNNQSGTGERLAMGIVGFLFLPFFITNFIGVVLHLVGLITIKKGFTLAAGILYIVSGALNVFFIIPIAIISILTFIAYSQID